MWPGHAGLVHYRVLFDCDRHILLENTEEQLPQMLSPKTIGATMRASFQEQNFR
jgi:hypothetical protein